MRRLLAGLLITYCGCFAVGYIAAERTATIKISTREDRQRPTDFYVTVTLPPVTAEYRWLEVYACVADIDSDGDVRCAFTWERRSLQETRPDQRQYPFLYRFAPRGTWLILAHASDGRWKTLATGRTVVMR